jgi:5'-3' exonuclease
VIEPTEAEIEIIGLVSKSILDDMARDWGSMINIEAMTQRAREAVERMAPCCQVDHVIVDASNLLYRFGHMEKLDVDRMVIVFLEKLVNLRAWYGAKSIHVVWEGSGENWRMALLPEYKAGRDPNSELRAAAKRAEVILRDILPMTTIGSWDPICGEGDDGFGALAEILDGTVGVYSTDRDLLQLASDRITLIVPQRGDADKAFGPAEVAAKLGGVPATLMIDVKGLQTDAGDNIPGVPGVGPKIAVDLILAHGTLDALLAFVESGAGDRAEGETLTAWRSRLRDLALTPARLEAIRTHAGQARVSRAVATIRRDLGLTRHPSVRHPAALRAALDNLGASSYLAQNFEALSL